MTAYPYTLTHTFPGVPAAGHIARGFWHPGAINGCTKCGDRVWISPNGVRHAIQRGKCVTCGRNHQ